MFHLADVYVKVPELVKLAVPAAATATGFL